MSAAKNYNILKATIWYTIGNILVKAVPFFVMPVFTRLMSTYDYGVFSLFTSYISILEIVLVLGFSSTVRLAKADKEIVLNTYVGSVIPFTALVSVVVILAINIYFFVGSSLLGMDRVLWNLLIIISLLGAVSNIIGSKLIIEGEYKKYLLYSVVSTVVNVAVSLSLCYTVFSRQDIYYGRIYGLLCGSLASTILLYILTRPICKINFNYVKKAFVWGMPLMFHALITVLLMQIDKWMIQAMCESGTALVGIYSIATTIIIIPMTLQSSTESAWSPWFYDKMGNKEYKSIEKLNDLYIFMFFVITSCFMFAAPEIIHIFSHENYWDSVYSLIPLLLGVFFEVLYWIVANVEFFHQKANYVWIASGITLGINVLLNYLFIKWFGYIGAAYATAISKFALFVFHYIFSKILDKKSVISLGKTIILLVISAGVCGLSVVLVKYTLINILIRWIIIAVLLLVFVLLVLNKKKILLVLINKSRETNKCAIVCNTPFQIFTAINVVKNTRQDAGIKFDLFVEKCFRNPEPIIEALQKSELFNKIYSFVRTSEQPKNRIRQLLQLSCKSIILKQYSFNDGSFAKQNYNTIMIGDVNPIGLYLTYNNLAPVIFFDDGMISYDGNAFLDNRKLIYKIYCKLFGLGFFAYDIKKLMVYNKEFCSSTISDNIEQLPNPSENQEVQECACKVFAYDFNSPYKEKRLVVLGQPLREKEGYNGKSFANIINEGIANKNEAIFRAHPRQTDNDYPDLSIDNINNQWELECLNSITEEHVLIGYSSTSQISPKLIVDKEPYIIFLYKIFQADSENNEYLACEKLAERVKNSYSNPDKVLVPADIEEFEKVVKTIDDQVEGRP